MEAAFSLEPTLEKVDWGLNLDQPLRPSTKILLLVFNRHHPEHRRRDPE